MYEHIPFFAMFIAGISCMWAISLRERVRAKEQELIRLQKRCEDALEEGKKLQELFHLQEKEHIALLKEHEVEKAAFQGIQKYILETKENLVERMKVLSHEVLTSTQSHFF